MRAIFLIGPTCVGKTKLGVAIARAVHGEVLSIDSLQCYEDGGIVTARPRPEEMKGVKHHLVGYLAADDELTDFTSHAMSVVDDLRARGKLPIFVGGSTSLLPPILRSVIERGIEIQVIILAPVLDDPQYESSMRARVHEMVDMGLVSEISHLHRMSLASMSSTSSEDESGRQNSTWGMQKTATGVWKAIGYPELIPYLESQEMDQPRSDLLARGLDDIVVNSLAYASTQLTFIRTTLIPMLHAYGISMSNLAVTSFDKRNWEQKVQQPALQVALDFAYARRVERADSILSTPKRPVVCIYGGSSEGTSPAHTEAAKSLAARFHDNGVHVVYGGGTTGVMAALATKLVALSGPDAVHGVIPAALAKYEEDNAGESGLLYTEAEFGKRTVVPDMHSRKKLMVEQVLDGGPGSGFVALSGGYGTAEELLEAVTWRQLGIHDRGICVLNVEGFYDGLLSWFGHIVQTGFVHGKDSGILGVVNSPEEVVEHLNRSRDDAGPLLSWVHERRK